MRTRILAILLLVAVALPGFAADQKDEKSEPVKIKVGDMAPDFTLLTKDSKGLRPISLHDYRGKNNVALAFYVFAFTGG